MVGSTSDVLQAALVFIFIHVLSSTPLRARIVGAIGESAFRGLFSVLSALALGWLIWAFAAAPYEELWAPAPWTRWIPAVVMPFAFIFLVFGLTTPNPVTAGLEGRIGAADPAPGFLKVTRHPLFWSFALWAAAHIPPNGDRASLYLFGGILALSLLGMPLIDRKKEQRFGAAWGPFALTTSAIPFVAAIQGRAKLRLADFSLWRIGLALVLYLAMFHGHEVLIGVSALP